MSEEKGKRGTGEEMNGFWKRSAGREEGGGKGRGRRRGNQSCEERGREESAECDFTAEDRSTSPRNVGVG